jgi:hypothetical protein
VDLPVVVLDEIAGGERREDEAREGRDDDGDE